MHGRVAQQGVHAGAVDDGPVHHPPTSGRLQVVEVDHHVEVGPVAPAGALGLVVQEEPAHVDQGIGPTPGRGAGRLRFYVG